MIIQYKLYKTWHTSVEFQEFIAQCEQSGCYPWSLITLHNCLARQVRYPNRHEGYTGRYSYYDCSWTYGEDNALEVRSWLTWMALKHNISFRHHRLKINTETNEVITKEEIYGL